MIDDFKALYEKDGSMTILSHIKGLRHYDGDESSFWSRYLALVALLCRSPVAHLLFTDNESGWKLSSIAYEDSGAKVDLAEIVMIVWVCFVKLKRLFVKKQRFQLKVHHVFLKL